MELPIYQLDISDDIYSDSGVFAVSIVKEPAIEEQALFFNSDKPLKFQVENEDQRIVSGPVLVADKPIYRNNEEFGEHNVTFSGGTIKKIMQKFFANGFQGNSNLDHNEALTLNGVTMYESFQIDRERGVNPPKGYDHLSDGSWFGSFKVHDEDVWEIIKKGEFTGFSIEGIFEYKMDKDKEDTSKQEEELMNEIMDLLNKIETNNTK